MYLLLRPYNQQNIIIIVTQATLKIWINDFNVNNNWSSPFSIVSWVLWRNHLLTCNNFELEMIQHHSIKAIIQISLSMFIDEVLSSDLLMTTHTNSTHPSNSVIWHLTSDHLITIQLHYSPRVFCMTYSLTTPYLLPDHHGETPPNSKDLKIGKRNETQKYSSRESPQNRSNSSLFTHNFQT